MVPNELDEFGDPVVVLSYRPQVNKQHNFEEEQQRHLPVHVVGQQNHIQWIEYLSDTDYQEGAKRLLHHSYHLSEPLSMRGQFGRVMKGYCQDTDCCSKDDGSFQNKSLGKADELSKYIVVKYEDEGANSLNNLEDLSERLLGIQLVGMGHLSPDDE